jgi:hypothetical protein
MHLTEYATSKAYSCQISALQLLPRLTKIFLTFFKKISEKLLSEFEKKLKSEYVV